jgi:p-aminobenzoyl-glutamate transporter AbgT
MRLSLGFILFLTLAALMLINAVVAFRSAARPADQKHPVRSSPLLTGVVSLIASAALVAGGFYMFWF